MSEQKPNKTNLATFRKNMDRVWSSNSTVAHGIRGTSSRVDSREKIVERIAKAKTPEQLREISTSAMFNQGYADVINYYKSMYYYRYVVTPIKQKNSKTGKVLEATKEMLEVTESINFEAILPNMLEQGLFEGAISLYLEKSGDLVKTHILPISHSRALLRSNYGTLTVVFDLDYFSELINELTNERDANVLSGETQKEKKQRREDEKAALTITILDFFPEFLKKAFLEYEGLDNSGRPTKGKEKGPRLVNLPTESAAIIPFSPSMAPPKINVSAAEENYKEVLEVQNKKHKAGLEKIFTHRIPIGEDGDLLLSVDEAQAIQRSMEQYIGDNADVTVLTTLGATELYDVQKESSERNKVVSDAYNTQFEAASINPQLFRADTDYALGVSLNRDAAFMWDIIQKIMNFYNISINELFNFGEFRCSIKMLPITTYNEEQRVTEYRRNAEYGIGKLEAIIATGEKQITLVDKLMLEKEMGLDELLTPLQSSHTRSSKEQGVQKEVKTSDEDDSSPNEKEAEEVKDEEKD